MTAFQDGARLCKLGQGLNTQDMATVRRQYSITAGYCYIISLLHTEKSPHWHSSQQQINESTKADHQLTFLKGLNEIFAHLSITEVF